jgi:hypothetical protein
MYPMLALNSRCFLLTLPRAGTVGMYTAPGLLGSLIKITDAQLILRFRCSGLIRVLTSPSPNLDDLPEIRSPSLGGC